MSDISIEKFKADSWPSVEEYNRGKASYIDQNLEERIYFFSELDIFKGKVSQAELSAMSKIFLGASFAAEEMWNRYTDSPLGEGVTHTLSTKYYIPKGSNVLQTHQDHMAYSSTSIDPDIEDPNVYDKLTDEQLANSKIVEATNTFNIVGILQSIRSGIPIKEVQAYFESISVHEVAHSIQVTEVHKKAGQEKVEAIKARREDLVRAKNNVSGYKQSANERSAFLWQRKFLRKFYPDVVEKYTSTKLLPSLRIGWTFVTTRNYSLWELANSKEVFKPKKSIP